MSRKRALLIKLNQNRSALYATYAREYRDKLDTRWGRFIYSRVWLEEKIAEWQSWANIYAQTARLLANIED